MGFGARGQQSPAADSSAKRHVIGSCGSSSNGECNKATLSGIRERLTGQRITGERINNLTSRNSSNLTSMGATSTPTYHISSLSPVYFEPNNPNSTIVLRFDMVNGSRDGAHTFAASPIPYVSIQVNSETYVCILPSKITAGTYSPPLQLLESDLTTPVNLSGGATYTVFCKTSPAASWLIVDYSMSTTITVPTSGGAAPPTLGVTAPPPFPTITFTIINMTPTQIAYKITSITGVSLPYTYSDYGYSPIVNLVVNGVLPSFFFPTTLTATIGAAPITTNLTYISNETGTLGQLPSGTYEVNMTYDKYNIKPSYLYIVN